jgi:hypothetical protein
MTAAGEKGEPTMVRDGITYVPVWRPTAARKYVSDVSLINVSIVLVSL